MYRAARMTQIANKARAAKGMSDAQLAASAQAAAKFLRRKGPMPTAELLALLGAEGLSVTEALSVVNHGFAHQLLMRDPGDPMGIAAGMVSLPARRGMSLKPPPRPLPPPPPGKGGTGPHDDSTSPDAS